MQPAALDGDGETVEAIQRPAGVGGRPTDGRRSSAGATDLRALVQDHRYGGQLLGSGAAPEAQ